MKQLSGTSVRRSLGAPDLNVLRNRLKRAAAVLAVASLLATPAAAQSHWSSNGPIILANGTTCQNISNLSVSLHVTQDLLATASGGDLKKTGPQQNGGFSMQLNASPRQLPVKPPVFWLQYLIVVKNNRAFPFIQYFDKAGTFAHSHPTILGPTALPAGNMIPAGYVLTVALTNDSSGNVTGATFGITDDAGKQTTVVMPSAALPIPNYGLTKNNNLILEPFSSVALAVVGPPSYETSTFSSGAGYITYGIPNGQLNQAIPHNCGSTATGEQSNVSYGMINPSAGSTLVQPLTTPFAGALASNMDTADNAVQVYHFTQYPPNGKNQNNGNFYLNQFAFNGTWNAQNVTTAASIPVATLGSPVIAYENTLSNVPEADYLVTTPQGDQQVEQLSGKTWTPSSLTSLAGAQAPALGSGLAGYVDPIAGSDNVFYQGTDRHVHLLTKPAGKNWMEEKGLANTTAASFASALTGHMAARSEEIFYFDNNRHIYELWRWSKNFRGWNSTDITRTTSAFQSAAVGSPLVGFYDAKADKDAVFIVGTDRHIHEFRYAKGLWPTTDLTLASNAPPVGVGSRLAAHVNPLTGSEEIFFVNSDQTLEEISSPSAARPVWTSKNLSKNAGGSPLAASPGSPLTTDINAVSHTDELYYVGSDGNVYELSSPNNRQWSFSTP